MVEKTSTGLWNDSHRLLSACALFSGDFCIDWLVDLSIGKKPSQILLQLENGVKEGLLAKKTPGYYCFKDPGKREKWRSTLSDAEQVELHGRISDVMIRELGDDDSSVLQIGRASCRERV